MRAAMPGVLEKHGTLDGQPSFRLEAEPLGDAPVVYLHGVPTCADDWLPFLARTGGIAPDLPGFGRAGKSGAAPYTARFYADWIERFLDELDAPAVRLVVHDWGAIGLVAAARLADRIERVVVIDALPLLPGYRWHRWARVWRTPMLGEVAVGLTMRRTMRRALPAEVVENAAPYFDQGTQRAILRLYRSASEADLAELGAGLGELDCPALVVHGEADPYIDTSFPRAYADVLRGELLMVPGAGHWPWLDEPDVIDRVATFLDA